jgi:hypothetical protein
MPMVTGPDGYVAGVPAGHLDAVEADFAVAGFGGQEVHRRRPDEITNKAG